MGEHWLVYKNRCLGPQVKCLSKYTVLCIVFILRGLVMCIVLYLHGRVVHEMALLNYIRTKRNMLPVVSKTNSNESQ